MLACVERSRFLFYMSSRVTINVTVSTYFAQAAAQVTPYLLIPNYCVTELPDLHLYSIFIVCCLIQFCYDGSTLRNKSDYYHTNWGDFVFMDLQLYLFSYLLAFLIFTMSFELH